MSNQIEYYKAVKQNDLNLVIQYLEKDDVDAASDNSFIYSCIHEQKDILELIIKKSNIHINKKNSWLIKQLIKNESFDILNMILSLDNNQYEIKFHEIIFDLKYGIKNNIKLFLNILNEENNNIDHQSLINMFFKDNDINITNDILIKYKKILSKDVFLMDEEIKTNLLYLLTEYDELDLFKVVYENIKNKKTFAFLLSTTKTDSVNIFKYLNNQFNYSFQDISSLSRRALNNQCLKILLELTNNKKLDLSCDNNCFIQSISDYIDSEQAESIFKIIIERESVNPLSNHAYVLCKLIDANKYNLIDMLFKNPYAVNFSQNDIAEIISEKKEHYKKLINYINLKNF